MVVCAGSGGVGKTTIAAAIAAKAAREGRKVLALTVDPAKRLATALGLDLSDDSEKRAALAGARGELWAAVIDSKKTFDGFVSQNASDPATAERLLNNRLYSQLSTTLSGSQEFTSLERLLQATESGRYDLVVLDTPPTKHAVDFLTAPQRIEALFQDSITRWFMSGGGGAPGLIAALVTRGTRAALKSLEVLTGGQFIEELIDFFAGVRAFQKKLRERSRHARELLTDGSTRFVVITSFDAAKLEEAKHLQSQLSGMNYRLGAVIINRAFPAWLPADAAAERARSADAAHREVLAQFRTFKQYYSNRYALYERFAAGLDRSVALFRIPEYERDVYGLEDLDKLADAFELETRK